MSYKISEGKTIDVINKYDSMGKTSGCHLKIRYLWRKQVDVI